MKPFRSLPETGRNLYLAIVYDEKFKVLSGNAHAIVLIEADKGAEAAAKLAGYAGKELIGKMAEFLRVPPAMAKELKHIQRGKPCGDGDPDTATIKRVCGRWMEQEVLRRRANDGGMVTKDANVARVGDNVMVSITDMPKEKGTTH